MANIELKPSCVISTVVSELVIPEVSISLVSLLLILSLILSAELLISLVISVLDWLIALTTLSLDASVIKPKSLKSWINSGTRLLQKATGWVRVTLLE